MVGEKMYACKCNLVPMLYSGKKKKNYIKKRKKLIRAQAGNAGKALLGLLLQHKGVKTSESFLCLLPQGGAS